jgi:hypothetical protein
MKPDNIEKIEIISEGLGDVLINTAFVGGSVMELYVDDPAISKPRITVDVDVVIELLTRAAYDKLEEELRKRGFINDLSGPVCRMIYKGVKVDIMSTDASATGFTNPWYAEGFENSFSVQAGKAIIKLFPVEYFIASKFAAYASRGKSNPIESYDLEDIIYVFDGRSNIKEDIDVAKSTVRKYLTEQIKEMLENQHIKELISGHLGYSQQIERTERILRLFKEIVEH